MTNNTIAGYRPLSAEDLANSKAVKEMEERVLRMIDGMKRRPDLDPRCLAEGNTCIQTGFMWLIRSIIRPDRIELDDEEESFFDDDEDDTKRLSPSGDE